MAGSAVSNTGTPLISVSQMAQSSGKPTTAAGGANTGQPASTPAAPALVSVADIAKNGIPEPTPAPEKKEPIQLSNPSTVPNARIRNLPDPSDPYASGLSNFLSGAGTGAELSAVPASAVGMGAAMDALPSVMLHTIDGVKAVGTWAAKNPVQAYLLLQVLKESVPGLKKAMGIISHAPEGQ